MSGNMYLKTCSEWIPQLFITRQMHNLQLINTQYIYKSCTERGLLLFFYFLFYIISSSSSSSSIIFLLKKGLMSTRIVLVVYVLLIIVAAAGLFLVF